MNSILQTIKKMLGIDADYAAFDTDIIVHVNSSIMALTQIGIGPVDGFFVTGSAEEWSDFIGNVKDLEAVKTYIYLKVRTIFDPPSSSYALDAMNRTAAELEWRLSIQADKPATT